MVTGHTRGANNNTDQLGSLLYVDATDANIITSSEEGGREGGREGGERERERKKLP